MRPMRYLVIVFMILAMSACGGGSSGTDEGEGAAGGGRTGGGDEISSPVPAPSIASSLDGKVTLEIDASALPEGVALDQIEISEAELPQIDGATIFLAYDFKPDGIVFKSPVLLTMSLEGVDLGGADPEDVKIGFIDGDNTEELETAYDANANTVSASITHFSIYVAGVAEGQESGGEGDDDSISDYGEEDDDGLYTLGVDGLWLIIYGLGKCGDYDTYTYGAIGFTEEVTCNGEPHTLIFSNITYNSYRTAVTAYDVVIDDVDHVYPAGD